MSDLVSAERERCARVLDDAAQDWNRIRDPGMANHCRTMARKIRGLPEPEKVGVHEITQIIARHCGHGNCETAAKEILAALSSGERSDG